MAKKIRVSILYNQPISGSLALKGPYVNERGMLRSELPIRRGEKHTMQEFIDMSEVGVVEEMDDIKEALNSIGYKTTTFNVDSDVVRLIDYLRSERPDVIFNLVECVENLSIHEMHVAGIYELLKIPYT